MAAHRFVVRAPAYLQKRNVCKGHLCRFSQNLTEVRKLAFEDLNECMYAILRDTLTYLDKNPDDVDSATKDAFAYYDTLHKERQESR